MKTRAFLVLLCVASTQAAAGRAIPHAIEPLIQVKVQGDSVRRILDVDVSWPKGPKPRFPRDEAGILLERSVARTGVERTSFGRIEENPDWAAVCERDGCRLTYRVDYGRAIGAERRGEDWDIADRQGVVMAPFVRWLVRPEDRRARGRLALDFEGGKRLELVTGVMDGRVNRVETDLSLLDGPHVVLGAFDHRSIEVPGGRIDVAIGKATRNVREEDLLAWVREGAADVISLLGRFPVARLQIIVGSGGPYSVGSAVTMGMGGASIFVVVGERTTRADLLRDWVMTHEMLHVAFPNMGSRQRWMEEGLSTYLEPLLRARRGRHDPLNLWTEFVRAMPQGLPREGDLGLDRTVTWGRRYWGGALFWLHVDLEIRRRTEGLRSLDDVLRAILGEGGSVAVRWDVPRLATVAEAATGTTVLKETYDEWATKAVAPDLPALWRSLGVRGDSRERISLDDTAPLATVRKRLTTAPSPGVAAASRPSLR